MLLLLSLVLLLLFLWLNELFLRIFLSIYLFVYRNVFRWLAEYYADKSIVKSKKPRRSWQLIRACFQSQPIMLRVLLIAHIGETIIRPFHDFAVSVDPDLRNVPFDTTELQKDEASHTFPNLNAILAAHCADAKANPVLNPGSIFLRLVF
jgi:hypothetical protein